MDARQVIDAASAAKLPPGEGGLVSRTLAPMADGRSLPAHPFHPQATAISRDVPLMIGTALGFASALTDVRPPEVVLSGLKLLGDALLPMMLFAAS